MTPNHTRIWLAPISSRSYKSGTANAALGRCENMRRAMLLLLLGCERAESVIDVPNIAPPHDAPLEIVRSSMTANDPPAPHAAPVAPDLVGLSRADKRWFLSLSREERHEVREICRMQKKDPCHGLMLRPRDLGTDEPDSWVANHEVHEFCFRANGRRNGCNTPLVLAFEAQPIVFETSPGTFMFEAGTPVASDWPTAATPWIALDRDGDGAITSGAELFGDGMGDAKDGFEALAALDSNDDGMIDHRDAAFASLVLWADTDGDRRSSSSELRPLSNVVTAIPLAHHLDVRCVRGNCEGERGSFTWRDGDRTHTGAVVDVYLRTAAPTP